MADDAVLPAVEILSPAVGSSYSPGTPSILLKAKAEAVGAKLVEVRVLLDHEMVLQQQTGAIVLPLENLEDGQHLLEVFAHDEAGVWGVASTWIRLHAPEDPPTDVKTTIPVADQQKDANPALTDREGMRCSMATSSNRFSLLALFCGAFVLRRRRLRRR